VDIKFCTDPKKFPKNFHGEGGTGGAIVEPGSGHFVVATDHGKSTMKIVGTRTEAVVHRPELFNVDIPVELFLGPSVDQSTVRKGPCRGKVRSIRSEDNMGTREIRGHPGLAIPNREKTGPPNKVSMHGQENNHTSLFWTKGIEKMPHKHSTPRVRKNMWARKIDIAQAFRNVPLHFLFSGHLAFRVGDFYHFELQLPFGFTWSLFMWNSFSDFIQHYCALHGVNCVVYCDDFLILAANKKDYLHDMSFLLDILHLLGVPVKKKKLSGLRKKSLSLASTLILFTLLFLYPPSAWLLF
jgi:hypothetical protein